MDVFQAWLNFPREDQANHNPIPDAQQVLGVTICLYPRFGFCLLPLSFNIQRRALLVNNDRSSGVLSYPAWSTRCSIASLFHPWWACESKIPEIGLPRDLHSLASAGIHELVRRLHARRLYFGVADTIRQSSCLAMSWYPSEGLGAFHSRKTFRLS